MTHVRNLIETLMYFLHRFSLPLFLFFFMLSCHVILSFEAYIAISGTNMFTLFWYFNDQYWEWIQRWEKNDFVSASKELSYSLYYQLVLYCNINFLHGIIEGWPHLLHATQFLLSTCKARKFSTREMAYWKWITHWKRLPCAYKELRYSSY